MPIEPPQKATSTGPVIVRERTIDCQLNLWQQVKRDAGRAQVPREVLWVIFQLPFIGMLVYFEIVTDTAHGISCVSALLLILYIIWLVQVIRQGQNWKRWQDLYLGNTATRFVEFSPEGIRWGIRGTFHMAVPWGLCTVDWHTSGQPAVISTAVGGAMPLPVDDLTEWERAQLRYWLDSAHGKHVDHCASCRYDLRGSPGPLCPECGAPIRVAAPPVPLAAGRAMADPAKPAEPTPPRPT